MTLSRVLYAIDYQRQGEDSWLKSDATTTWASGVDDDGAKQLAELFELAKCWVARQGCRVRLRVWTEPADLFAFDLDTEPVGGTWIYEPEGTR